MKKTVTALFLLLFFTSSFWGCKEVPPNIDLKNPATSADTVSVSFDALLSLQRRNVLIEDYTGVRCVNCPSAHEAAANIMKSYPPGRIVVVAEHDSAGLLTLPYPFGSYDFRTKAAYDIVQTVGPISAKPIGAVNRKYFPDETTRTIAKQKWAGYAAQEYADSVSSVQMKLEHNYNDVTRTLSLGIILQYTQSITSILNLSVMLTESGMKEPQLGGPKGGPSGIDTFYVHRHVLRGMITPSLGRPVIGNKTPGHATKYLFSDFALPSTWNADSCSIIAFITAGNDSVLQVVESSLRN